MRRTDVITGRVLDLIDQHMLIGAPENRYTATAVCDECENLLARAKRDLPPLGRPQSTRSALLDNPNSNIVDVEPLVLPQVSLRPSRWEPTTEQQDSQILPLSQADVINPPQSYRLMANQVSFRGSNSPLKSAGEWSHTPGPHSPPTLPDNGVWPTTSALSNRNRLVHSSVEKSHPVPTMTIAEARKAIDREHKSSFLSRFKAKKGDEFLSKHIQNRDLVSRSPRPVLS